MLTEHIVICRMLLRKYLRGEFKALKGILEKKKRSQISFHPEMLKTQKQIKTKVSRGKKIIDIRA